VANEKSFSAPAKKAVASRRHAAVKPPFANEAASIAAEAPVLMPPAVEIANPALSLAVITESKPAEPATLSAIQEGPETMATSPETTQVADKAQAMFGDMNTRFKSAFEKSSKMGEEIVDFTKGNVEALVASARVAAKGGETIGQEAAEYSKKSFENAMAVFKSFASVKSPTELFQLQSDFAKSSFDSAVAEASKLSESLLKIAGEVAQPLSTRYAVAAEKIKASTL